MSNEITRHELAYEILMWELLKIIVIALQKDLYVSPEELLIIMAKAAGELS